MEQLQRTMAELDCDDESQVACGFDKRLGEASGDEQGEEFSDSSDVCAICLGNTEPADFATVKGCEHTYCVHCILQWAQCKEAPWCPQCKKPFNYLYCHRLLDGTLSDIPVEESVCLLKRASWFVEHVQTLEKGKLVSSTAAADTVPEIPEWNEYYDELEEDEDEEIEKYYFSSAAGRARIVLGNRRLGENGFLKAGRVYARPAPAPAPASSKGKGKAANTSSAAASSSKQSGGPGGPSGSGSTSSAAAPAVGGPSTSSAGKQGRRAKRNAKRLAADGDDGLDW